MTLISTTKELTAACRRLGTHPFITVDTEFLRETTFWPRLCVVQIASEEEAVAVDAMAEGLDLGPFFELMADNRLTKVFHAARQDLEIIWNLARLIPAPLFDTQVAAMVCGFGDQVSYGDLVKTVTKVTLDKSSRFTDWSRRPLLPAQAEYAIADVTYLRDIYRFLQAKLDETGRIGWLDDEMAILTSPSINGLAYSTNLSLGKNPSSLTQSRGMKCSTLAISPSGCIPVLHLIGPVGPARCS